MVWVFGDGWWSYLLGRKGKRKGMDKKIENLLGVSVNMDLIIIGVIEIVVIEDYFI